MECGSLKLLDGVVRLGELLILEGGGREGGRLGGLREVGLREGGREGGRFSNWMKKGRAADTWEARMEKLLEVGLRAKFGWSAEVGWKWGGCVK